MCVGIGSVEMIKTLSPFIRISPLTTSNELVPCLSILVGFLLPLYIPFSELPLCRLSR